MKKTEHNIRLKIVLPLVIMLCLSALILTFGGYKIESRHLDNEVKAKTAEINKLFSKLLAKEAKIMEAQLQFIANDQGLITAWQSRNRPELYAKAASVFQRINTRFRITHFYFVEPDTTCFLRVHAPEIFGDKISRFTMQQAVGNTKISSGIELGPLGTFTLRTVYPWVVEGKLLGYLELGHEVEDLASRLKQVSGHDLIFTIDKINLDREIYESRMQSRKKDSRWDEFPDVLIIDKSNSTLSPEIKDLAAKVYSRITTRVMKLGEASLSICGHPLKDVSGRRVGSTLVISDITRKTMETRETVKFMVMAILLIFLAILLFYYRYSGMIGQQIYSYQNNLEDLIRERTRELHIALDEVKTLSGYLPICASCKQIRDDKGYWTQIESYIRDHSDAEFSHGICPDCAGKLYPNIKLPKKD